MNDNKEIQILTDSAGAWNQQPEVPSPAPSPTSSVPGHINLTSLGLLDGPLNGNNHSTCRIAVGVEGHGGEGMRLGQCRDPPLASGSQTQQGLARRTVASYFIFSLVLCLIMYFVLLISVFLLFCCLRTLSHCSRTPHSYPVLSMLCVLGGQVSPWDHSLSHLPLGENLTAQPSVMGPHSHGPPHFPGLLDL